MSIINNMPSKSMSIEGIIEEYKVYAGEEITAGGFVEFIQCQVGTRNVSSKQTYFTGYWFDCIALDSERLLYCYYDSNRDVFARVIKVTAETTFYGTAIQLDSLKSNNISPISVAKLDNGYYVVTYAQNYTATYSTYNGMIYASILSISSMTITRESEKLLSDSSYNGNVGTHKIEVVSEGFMFFFTTGDEQHIDKAKMVTVSDTAMNTGTEVTLHTSSSEYDADFCTIKMSSDMIFGVFWDYQAYGGYVYGQACTLIYSGTVLSTDLTLSINKDKVGYPTDGAELIKIDSATVIFLPFSSITDVVSKKTFTISSDSITVADSGTLISLSYPYRINALRAVPLSSLYFLILYVYYSSSDTTVRSYRGRIASYSNSTLTAYTETVLYDYSFDTYNIMGYVLNSSNFYIMNHTNTAGQCYGRLWKYSGTTLSNTFTLNTYEQQVRNPTTEDVNGVAKSSGSGGDTITIYAPDI